GHPSLAGKLRTVLYCAAEGCPSGLRCRSRKAVRLKRSPWVRIPPLPPQKPVSCASDAPALASCVLLILEESHRGLVGATGNRVCQKHRGFESHLLRHRPHLPFSARLPSTSAMGSRSLVSWASHRETEGSIQMDNAPRGRGIIAGVMIFAALLILASRTG